MRKAVVFSRSAWTISGSSMRRNIISFTSVRRPASENGPIIPPKTGLPTSIAFTFATAETVMEQRPASGGGTTSSATASSSPTSCPVTTGTSLSLKRTCAPNASASTERSIGPSTASTGRLRAIQAIVSAWRSADFTNSPTVWPSFRMIGKERTGMNFIYLSP